MSLMELGFFWNTIHRYSSAQLIDMRARRE
jgi:hypothetical protein